MRQKKKEKAKEERQTEVRSNKLPDFFYGLTDKLPSPGQEHLSEILNEKERNLANIRDKEKDNLKYELEYEKEINSVWKTIYNILFPRYERLSADYANFQKRTSKQTALAICYEKEKIIKTLLPALDNFEHTLQNADSAENSDVFVKGIEIIYDQMLDILKSHGVEQIKAPGEKFDPALHEAMMQKTEPEEEDNIVLEEFQKGYKLNGRVIRPSKVVVNKLTEDGGQKTEDGTEVE